MSRGWNVLGWALVALNASLLIASRFPVFPLTNAPFIALVFALGFSCYMSGRRDECGETLEARKKTVEVLDAWEKSEREHNTFLKNLSAAVPSPPSGPQGTESK